MHTGIIKSVLSRVSRVRNARASSLCRYDTVLRSTQWTGTTIKNDTLLTTFSSYANGMWPGVVELNRVVKPGTVDTVCTRYKYVSSGNGAAAPPRQLA